jgi:hypothetical protein
MRRLLFFTLLSGLWLPTCAAGVPPPPCRVVSTQGTTPPYLARLSVRERRGACDATPPATVMKVGVQDLVSPGAGPSSLALKPERLVDLIEGRGFSANVDARNDCQAALEGDPQPRCETCSADGGNACLAVADPIRRKDPSDPSGARLVAVAPFSREPANGRCSATGALEAQQSFQAETLRLVDGGTAMLPALEAKLTFTDVSVVATAEVPGTAFTATLTQVEGPCTITADVVAFFPAVRCSVDAQCATAIDLDAGISTVSGINPLFEPVCDTAVGYCVPTVDVTKPGLPPLP